MFFGQFDTTVDHKWRLLLPSSLVGNLDDYIFLRISENGCVRIYPNVSRFKEKDYPYIFKCIVKKGNRVVIPTQLRDSISFYYGKKITVVGYGHCLELWPQPKKKEER